MKGFLKRMLCMVLILMLAVVWVPDMSPQAQAAGVIPMVPPSFIPYGLTSPDGKILGYDSLLELLDDKFSYAHYLNVQETMAALNRAAGVQYVSEVDKLIDGFLLLNKKEMATSIEINTTLYNALTANEKDEVWQQSLKLTDAWASGAETILEFSSSLIESVSGKYKEYYPAVSTGFNGLVTTNITSGMSLADIVQNGSYAITSKGSVYRYVRITNPFYYYDDKGNLLVADNYFPNSNPVYETPLFPALLNRGYDGEPNTMGIGWLTAHKNVLYGFQWSVPFYYNGNKYFLNPPVTTTDDAPPIYPPEITITIPAPTVGADPYEEFEKRISGINDLTMPEILNPTGTDIDEDKDTDVINGKDRIDELTDLVLNLSDQLNRLEEDLLETMGQIEGVRAEIDDVMQEIERLRELYDAGGGEDTGEENELDEDDISNAIENIDDHRKTHILQDKHNWNKLVPDPDDPNNWNKITAIIFSVLANGQNEPYKTALKKVLEINGEIVEVIYKYVDGILRISDAWVKWTP